MDIFERLRNGLRRTTDHLAGRFGTLASEPRRSGGMEAAIQSIDTLDTLEEILLEADLGVVATSRLIDAVRDRADSTDRLGSSRLNCYVCST